MGLFDAIRVGLSGLNAAQMGMEAAQNNVANVNTPGYARLRANLEEVVVSTTPTLNLPGGVRVQGVEGLRDRILEARVATTESAVAGADSALRYLDQVESTVAPGGSSALGDPLAQFFGALTQLSARPEDPGLRAGVVDAGRSLATKLSQTATSLSGQLGDAQRELALHADRVNDLSDRIAALNRELAGTGGATASHAAVLTRRTALLDELAREVNVSTYVDSDEMLHVTLAQGQALVSGADAHHLAVDAIPGGGISLGTADVTAVLTGGAMGGILAARDATILPALARLDALASGLATSVNAQHHAGFDLAGNPGGDVYSVAASTGPGTVARSLKFLLSDGAQVAAGGAAAPGDGANAKALAALAADTSTVTTGTTPSSFSGAAAALSYATGSAAQKAQDDRATAGALNDQAVAAREALSGVSLDEEATDMIRYQRAFEASSRFLSTVSDLLSELIDSLGK